ncbi:DUF305 domain-containing protein [Spirilliplanes yamanashiensis]|uniref:DUF305 domain-containing protein n=1 Tax=Spirilliplanes yamanashiensis TaxID=42233 RepID=A0A8J4DK44_9ACTN|nr:DUF305 domain-containing protein [Spirilliplanes yamanashiensis]MDP9817701.1 uncharacterized protein (DUF305 family) [Spirilliplanes yamanashiensis]GIJ04511.1 DUF305 domain-containing protein [Spirilliplanes yamanashiensis]
MRLRVTLAAVAASAAVLVAAGCGTQPDEPAPQGGAAAPAASAASGSFNETDTMFLQMMVPHSTQGIAIVKLAADRSEREDVKTLAKAIEVTQQDEIKRMSGWLEQWKQPATASDKEHEEHGGMPGTSEKEISALRKAKGAEFDRLFLDTLIAHQDDAVQLARMETNAGVNVQATSYAKQVDQSRTAQIAQMLEFRKQ